MNNLFNDAIDDAVRNRNIEFLIDLIRRDNLRPEIREHLATVIEGLLTKKISFPNRKPKQDLEEKRQAIARRVLEVKKTKRWKLRSVVDFVAKEKRLSPKTVWTAWGYWGPALVAGELLREKYDLDRLFNAIKVTGQEWKKLSDEDAKILNGVVQESMAIKDNLRRNTTKSGRCK